jgi:hypothetical protein
VAREDRRAEEEKRAEGPTPPSSLATRHSPLATSSSEPLSQDLIQIAVTIILAVEAAL